MSNHYHLVLHINKDKALALSLHEVVEHWGREHKLPVLIERWQNKEPTNQAEEDKCLELIEVWRERLWSLSWFMKELNYDIACRANREDNCTGHFWESRFKSQALLDEKALAAAMAYVDLNPIRAGIATTPCLHPFIGNPTNEMLDGIPFRLIDYIELVDWTARLFREGKASMDANQPAILARLNFNQKSWLTVCSALEKNTFDSGWASRSYSSS